ncbi:hypothetical protein RQP46_008187 [Phenoliferia psychrophenolica]
MSLQDSGSAKSGSPPPELEQNEAEDHSRCLITSLPAELLSTIHALVFSGLSLVDEQLQRYHLQSVCRGFNSFFSRPNKELIVANVDRAVALKKALKSNRRTTPKSIKLYLRGMGSSRGEKFAALISACDKNVLEEVALEYGQKPLGSGRFDWIGVPLRKALCAVKMEYFRLSCLDEKMAASLSVDMLEELLAAWPRLRRLEIGSVYLGGSRAAPPAPGPGPAPLQRNAAAPPPAAAPSILPKHLIKIDVRINSTDACTLIQELLKSSQVSLYILHIQGSYLVGSTLQYLQDLVPAIPRWIRHFSCQGGDVINSLYMTSPNLESFDLWSAAIDASSSTTMAILRSVPSVKRVGFVVNSPTIDFGPSDLIKYFSGVEHVDEFAIHVCEHIRKSSPLALWDKEELDEVKEVARAEKIEFTIVDS